MNNITLIGRTTKAPEVRTSASGVAVGRFTLAVDREKEGADFISVICFGKTAELVQKYVDKGKQLGISGRIQTGSYEKDGHKIYTTDVVADRVEFLGKKENSEAPEGFSQITDDDIPF